MSKLTFFISYFVFSKFADDKATEKLILQGRVEGSRTPGRPRSRYGSTGSRTWWANHFPSPVHCSC